jgi:hypothetical protein
VMWRALCTIPNSAIGQDLNAYPNGTVIETNYIYYSNGTIGKTFSVYNHTEHGSITTPTNVILVSREEAPVVGTYEEALSMLPFRSYDETAARLVDHIQTTTQWLRNQSVPAFTSDYALHWFDYQGGYDVVLTQVGGNRSINQDIALGRGAATAQNKDWGTILCWKSDIEPYLSSGDEMYSQTRASYEAGAKYVVVFNYPALAGNLYGGAMQKEHFQALERFWNDCVQNPQVAQGANQAEAALVLPHDYGWGLRRQNDTIWGFWQPDDKAPAVWSSLQNALAVYGARLDIVYDDPAYPVSGKYSQVIYWNQTEPATFNSQAPG